MDATTLTPLVCGLLMAAGFAGGFIDAIAGGGGLITVPSLLAAGLPPQVALGTNKLQSACGTALAVRRYAGAGLLTAPGIGTAAAAALLAGAAGAFVVGQTSPEILRLIIPWLLAAVALYTALNRRFGLKPGKARVPPLGFALCAGLVLGFYDGFFGPGTGSFWMVALVGLRGLDLRYATGFTKAVNLASNLGALAWFLAAGSVHLTAAGFMIAGQLAGARLGSGWVIRDGLNIIRPVFLVVVLALTLKLMLDVWTAP
jgi:uncharacterized membrane protein YfcA